MRHVRLSRTMSHALRHEPWLYELERVVAGNPRQRFELVHLSVTREVVDPVGRRKGERVRLLTADPAAARAAGVVFLRGNEFVRLAEHVPAGFLSWTPTGVEAAGHGPHTTGSPGGGGTGGASSRVVAGRFRRPVTWWGSHRA